MSQDAINASAQNAVVAINGLNKAIETISTSSDTAATTLAAIEAKQFGTTNTSPTTGPGSLPLVQTNVYAGAGTIARISVIASGTTQGYIYDKASTGATASQYLSAIPATIGIYELHLHFSLGIVVEPGLSQTVLVSYTPD